MIDFKITSEFIETLKEKKKILNFDRFEYVLFQWKKDGMIKSRCNILTFRFFKVIKQLHKSLYSDNIQSPEKINKNHFYSKYFLLIRDGYYNKYYTINNGENSISEVTYLLGKFINNLEIKEDIKIHKLWK